MCLCRGGWWDCTFACPHPPTELTPRARLRAPRPDLFLDPLDMAAAEGFDLAAELEVAADLVVREDAEAVDHGQRPPAQRTTSSGSSCRYGSCGTARMSASACCSAAGRSCCTRMFIRPFLVAEEPRPGRPGAG